MNRHVSAFVMLCALAATPATPAGARDLWGDNGMVLAGQDTPVLARTVRLSPETRLVPIPRTPDATETLPPEIEAAADPNVEAVDIADVEFGEAFEQTEPAAVAPNVGRVITAPPVPGRENGAIVDDDISFGGGVAANDGFLGNGDEGILNEPSTDEIPTGGSDVSETAAMEEPDISEVEMFNSFPADDPKVAEMREQGIDVAGIYEPTVTLPPTVEPRVPDEPRRPPPQFNSAAYTGVFTGIGIAEGMRLELETDTAALHGWFLDSTGQIFDVDGEITTRDGQAQGVVISAGRPIGYLDLQLTNLGLTALFVPLAEDLSPLADAARQYEFLRALSPAAATALEAERAAREAGRRDAEEPHIETGPLRERFPGDDDRFE